ncbi:MAG: glycosyltransferase [Candidatus Omnitrophica bacterium]|nr:glycosyltransferase [Candidatus Omnitrophota bacterium]
MKSPSIWTYSDGADRGFGLFKRRLFDQLKKSGWETRIAEAPLLESSSKSILREDLLRTKPAWIFLINQTASQLCDYLQIPQSDRPLNGKKWIWFLDDPHFFVDKPFEPNEYVFSFDAEYLDYLRGFQPSACGWLPLACDVGGEGKPDPRYSCDVCFVGGVIDQSSRRSQLSPGMRAYVDRLVDLKLQNRCKTFYQLAEEHPIAPGKQIQITPPVAHYLYWEANNRLRIQTLESLQDYNLRIYGNEHWPRLLQGSPLAECFCGPIDPVTELPSLFASAQINLNIHSIQCRGSLNQRDFNAPVSGGFLLSDWVPAAGRFFSPGVEAIYWSGQDDLRRKIDYYLHRPEERQSVIRRGRRRISQDHTYARRIEQTLQHLRECTSLV